MPAQGDAAWHQTGDLATAGGSGRYDADPVAPSAADCDGWQDSHMHEFRIEGRRPAVRSARIGDVLTEIEQLSDLYI
jgi:hypothetical protein